MSVQRDTPCLVPVSCHWCNAGRLSPHTQTRKSAPPSLGLPPCPLKWEGRGRGSGDSTCAACYHDNKPTSIPSKKAYQLSLNVSQETAKSLQLAEVKELKRWSYTPPSTGGVSSKITSPIWWVLIGQCGLIHHSSLYRSI